MGSADKMVSKVDEAIGLAASITFVVCCATSTTVYNKEMIMLKANIHFKLSATMSEINDLLEIEVSYKVCGMPYLSQ